MDVHGTLNLVAPVRAYIDGLVHASAQCDALTMARHRAFIAPRLLGSAVALAAFPLYIAMRGVPSPIEIVIFSWLMLPILVAYFLSRTGRYEGAHILSSLSLTSLVAIVALATGGIGSSAAIWLVMVPLEAALSASRRVVAAAATLALLAAGLLIALGAAGALPAPQIAAHDTGALAALGIISAALYATGLALGAESLARTSFWLFYAEEDRYRLLARNMTDVISRHGRNGGVLFISPAAATMFGARTAELHGHGLFDRVHVADRPAYLTALADAAANAEERAVEFRVRAPDPQTGAAAFIWVEMRCRPLIHDGCRPPIHDGDIRNQPPVHDGGTVVHDGRTVVHDGRAGVHDGRAGFCEVVAVMRDVSPQKMQQQALERAREEAESANVSKGRFLATMSHELRTPLNAIIGFSEMLTKEEDMRLDPARRAEYATLINDAGHHLLSVVNGILDMSKIETGEFTITPEPFDVGQILSQCCDILMLKAREADLQIVTKIPNGLPDIVADKRALKQIMLNLLSNAVKFSSRGSMVAVSAEYDGAAITIAVEDTGVGIGEEDLPRLGKPFFQARGTYDRRHEGTGLGLSIVKGLVRLHGGRFDIRSTLGKGTTVVIRLPLNCEVMPAAVAPRDPVAPVWFPGVVDAANNQVRKSA